MPTQSFGKRKNAPPATFCSTQPKSSGPHPLVNVREPHATLLSRNVRLFIAFGCCDAKLLVAELPCGPESVNRDGVVCEFARFPAFLIPTWRVEKVTRTDEALELTKTMRWACLNFLRGHNSGRERNAKILVSSEGVKIKNQWRWCDIRTVFPIIFRSISFEKPESPIWRRRPG